MTDKTCIICLNELGDSKIIEYNHCGIYNIHVNCLNEWRKKSDQCIICRENITENLLNDEITPDFVPLSHVCGMYAFVGGVTIMTILFCIELRNRLDKLV